MGNAERQAAWRDRQRNTVNGRRFEIKGLTLTERDHLRQCLANLRAASVTPVTPESQAVDSVTPVTAAGGDFFDQEWLRKIREETDERKRREQAAWDALSPEQQAKRLSDKAERDTKNKARAQKAAETRRRNQPYAKSTFMRYGLEELRRIRSKHHPDRNPDGDLKMYQLAVEEIDRRKPSVTP
ncbi:hypothetical protein MCERE10_01810 [Burkholderiaceae bacterium]